MSAATSRPAWRIVVDGADLTGRIADRLVSLTLTDNPGFDADQVDIVLDDRDGLLEIPPRGAELRVSIGHEGEPLVDKGSYVVDEIEHSGAPDQLTLRARSADLRGGLATQIERSFHGKTVADIVGTIAAENDLTAVVAAELDSEVIAHADQTNESSASFLTRLAAMFGAIATVKDGKLLFMPSGFGRSASGKALPAVTIERADGDQHRFTLAERDACTAVRALYYDTGSAKRGEILWGKSEEAIAQGKEQPVAAVTAQSAAKYKAMSGTWTSRAKAETACKKAWKALRPKEGWDGVKAAYNDRVNKVSGWASWGRVDEEKRHANAVAQARRDEAKIDGTEGDTGFDHSADNVRTLRHVYATRDNAKRAARAEYLRLGRGTAVFSIALAKGRPGLFPGIPVTVRGFKTQIDACAWISGQVVHSISDAGYTGSVALEVRSDEIPE